MTPTYKTSGPKTWFQNPGSKTHSAASKTSGSEKGSLHVQSEDIFPIIKQFLYHDQEVFLRELVSNAVDATTKFRYLQDSGKITEAETETSSSPKIRLSVNEKAQTLTISDEGVGMSASEVKEYITRLAFSGAKAFVEKYQKEGEKEIIGHFGLGFYSAFMVAKKVELITCSWQKNTPAVLWRCEGSTNYSLHKTIKKTRGTDVVLYLDEKAAKEYLSKDTLKALLKKYCQFMPVDIEFDGEIINDSSPAWVRNPKELEKKDYLALYRRLYPFLEEPMFWIHLHVEYPFELKGILYFPPKHRTPDIEQHKIHLYARQVFITHDVEQVVPPFLQMLHGVLDSPEIPLNVSRSALQKDSRVKQIHAHVSKKVADKLSELFSEDRPNYESQWAHLSTFVHYGMLTDEKFAAKAETFGLWKSAKEKYYTLAEYKEKLQKVQQDSKGNYVFLYTQDVQSQQVLLDKAYAKGYDVLVLDNMLCSHIVGHMEGKFSSIRWYRLDAAPLERLLKDPSEQKKESPKIRNGRHFSLLLFRWKKGFL